MLHVARQYAADPDAWPLAPRFDPVQRWYHRLATHDDYEVWLLTWLPGQGTDLHDHGDSAGAFVVVRGELTEEVVVAAGGAQPPALAQVRHARGDGRAFDRYHVHRIINAGTTPAVSVHVYGPALKTMRRYRWREEGLVVAEVEKAGVDW